MNLAIVLTLAWLAAELLYYTYFRLVIVASLQPLKERIPPIFRQPSTIIFSIYDILQSIKSYSFTEFCSGFCLKHDIQDIYIKNYESFMSWALYLSHPHQLNAEEATSVSTIVSQATMRFNAPSIPGNNEKVNHAKFNLDPMNVTLGFLKNSHFI